VCAAPGSKTFQLLEILHHSTKVGSLPDGMVCVCVHNVILFVS